MFSGGSVDHPDFGHSEAESTTQEACEHCDASCRERPRFSVESWKLAYFVSCFGLHFDSQLQPDCSATGTGILRLTSEPGWAVWFCRCVSGWLMLVSPVAHPERSGAEPRGIRGSSHALGHCHQPIHGPLPTSQALPACRRGFGHIAADGSSDAPEPRAPANPAFAF